MPIAFCPDARAERIAVLYQSISPPTIGGLRKAPKPGGYADSGADIAYALKRAGYQVVTPKAQPDPAMDLDWVFPDDVAGIVAARAAGATLLWANTVLFEGHPLGAVMGKMWIVGQPPKVMHRIDDKFATNLQLRVHSLPVAVSILAALSASPGVQALDKLDAQRLATLGLFFPMIVKPVRGRGSQGVTRVDSSAALHEAAQALLEGAEFGDQLIIEQYLPGEELTVTVFPAQGAQGGRALPPVRRFNHQDGVAPYNGTVAVAHNSAALSAEAQQSPAVMVVLDACVDAARVVGALAPIRIDCRQDSQGSYRLFDLNAKPYMTGAGRPGRDDQDSLSAIAARAMGWDYAALLGAMASGAWRVVS
ncbi:ATP-grasp domain-containing protein [Pigmentiphaga aceris]|uniref:ATP-grasp domain-containing protein n=1 Tax=Pigmentiphaga aceris TaxID=1940612 RepID=A0A5C0AWC8_9BURK|nr:ATP-grasp domain-containing protein [Pigmentiphaga aceris]QEI05180.1 ATP-grasp domain-containing protein [Pigmentiphaga aceris]